MHLFLNHSFLRADLHIHTNASDGKLSPTQLVTQALQRDLDVIAITDHDTIAGVGEAQMAADGTGLGVVQGAEVSTLFEGRECHLLAYAFEDAGIMQKLLGNQKNRRVSRARTIVANLNKLGFDLSFDDVLGEAGRASIGRPHIARVMVKKGYASTNQEVFFRYLGNGSSAYHQIDYPDIALAIERVHQAGGYAVLAHPADTYNFIELKKLKDYGLDGIECYHPSHNSAHQRRYLDYCTNYNLIPTGGSDFHGSVQDFYHLGVIHCNLPEDSPLLKATDYRASDKTGTY